MRANARDNVLSNELDAVNRIVPPRWADLMSRMRHRGADLQATGRTGDLSENVQAPRMLLESAQDWSQSELPVL